MVKWSFILSIVLFSSIVVNAQTYISDNYASIGDTVYLTKCELNSENNYDTSGSNFTWDFSNVVGQSQDRILFKNPTQTGFTILQYPYIFNSNNVNLASSDGKTIAIGGIQQTNVNNYLKKTTSSVEQRASSFDLSINGTSLSIKNTFTSADVLYKFPINYGNIDSSNAEYSIYIPGNIYFRQTILKRKNSVDGTGTLITPYGTFSDVLRMISTVNQSDTIAIAGTGIKYEYNYRELLWFSASKKYPVMIVKQTLIGNSYITDQIQYLDTQQFFQPEALFAYVPLSPSIGDTVQFQNLSSNAYEFLWDFDDISSGSLNTSSEINPTHIFNSADTFNVKLISTNGSLHDTIALPILVNSGLSPIANFNSSESNICQSNSIIYTDESENASFYQWTFEGGIPSVSFEQNPNPILYLNSGFFIAKLKVSNSNGVDSLIQEIQVINCLNQENLNDKSIEISVNNSNKSISISGVEGRLITYILSIDGKIVESEIINSGNNNINISKLNKGVYIFYMLYKNNLITKKIVIE
ncbi:MAG TPA: hypothetical protein DDX39_05720 [Bacteroidales bacterium]|nr:MAG: hypothetical protein A2W98_06990 [Bacteroidetes bacterium GWF2_33_38]OFY72425.1 MAG: hypothetical protein A2265_05335 [Bacteroidetes bacterium RIFOXYA12_FULL_33_9]OFY89347.1 MAG: hypothetical protein A2236_08100 [Bacteroidetes bacterium RIFOXYA2_FULL_33_7]HBF88122.1 hypothetical protein [Bacteroidales bacterium]